MLVLSPVAVVAVVVAYARRAVAPVEASVTVEPRAPTSRPTGAGTGATTTGTVAGAGARSSVRAELRAGLVPVVAAWVVSRLVASAALVLGGSEDLGRLTYGWLDSWDGSWYRLAAIYGYDGIPNAFGQTTWPFFPLLPGLSRGAQELGVPERLAGLAITNVVFLVALAGTWVLARRHLSRRGALIAVWATALFPFGITFGMVYPSSLYLAGSVWAFVFLERRHDVAAALCAVVPTLARPNGFIVPAVLVLALWLRDRGGGRPSDRGRRALRAVLVGVPAGVGLAVWCGLLWRWSGDPLVFYSAKDAWDEVTILEFFGDPGGETVRTAVPHMLGVAAAIGVLAASWRAAWFRVEWKVLAVLSLAPPLLLGVVGLGRYAAECFPLALATGFLLDRLPRRLASPALVVAGAGLFAFGVAVTRHGIVP